MGRVKLRFKFRHAFKVSQIYQVIIGKRVSEIKPKFYEDPMELLVIHIHQDKIYFNIFRYKTNFTSNVNFKLRFGTPYTCNCMSMEVS